MNTKTNPNTKEVIAKLFSVGAHFGFTKRRRHPSMIPFLFGAKDGNDIFDLEKTAEQLDAVSEVVKTAASEGKIIMYVSTKDETKRIVREVALAVDAPYVANRWIGGLLTNFTEIRRRVQRLNDLEEDQNSGDLERKYTKKERVMIGREIEKLRFNFGGVQTMSRRPDLLVVVDPRYDEIAIKEAKALNIPTIGIMGSDCDRSDVTYPVVMNDSVKDSVQYALETIIEAHKSGSRTQAENKNKETETKKPTQ